MGNVLQKTYNWLGFILLLLSITCYIGDISLFHSGYIVFYGLGILGLIFSYIGWRALKLKTEDTGSITKIVGKIGFYGNLVVVILFFYPLYFIWGGYILGP